MNGYVRLSRAKAELHLAASTQDAALVRTIGSVSRAIDRYLAPRHFYSRVATLYLDGSGGAEQWLLDAGEVISVESIGLDEDGDGTFEVALAENTDYVLWPWNEPQKSSIRIMRDTAARSYFASGTRNVQVVAKLGYSEDTESAGALGEALDASETAITMAADHSVELGDTMLVDDEQMYVSAVVTNTLTVTRGFNGTTAASHLTAAPVTVRRYPEDIEHATMMQLSRYRWDLQEGFQGAVEMSGDAGRISLWPQVKGILKGYEGMSLAAELVGV